MKTPVKYLSLFGTTVLLFGCSDESGLLNPISDSQKLPITLAAAYPTATRASDGGFEDGDLMGVYVMDYLDGFVQDISSTDIHAANGKFIFDGKENKWNAINPIYWTSKDTPADIVGYYPYSESISNPEEFAFSIARRQDEGGSETSLGGYEASDFLWAKAEKCMPSDSKVNLTLRHIMAGIRVTLKEGSGFDSGEWDKLDKKVLIPNIKPSTSVDLSSGLTGNASGDPVSVCAYQYGEDWRAVVVPQTIPAGNVVDLSIDGVSYSLSKESSTEYQSGKLTSFTITVNKRGGGEYEFKIIDESITAWIDDAGFRDGIVRSYTTVDVPRKGSLQSIIARKNISETAISALKLTGEINEQDFYFMRDKCASLKSLNLKEVTVWAGDRKNVIPEKAMCNKSTLMHIVFPDDLQIIGDEAFFRSGLMGSLIIPEGVTKIGERECDENDEGWIGAMNNSHGVFAYCGNLSGNLSLPSTIEYLADYAFAQSNFTGMLSLPESLKTIGNCAFESNKFEGELILPDNIEYVGAGAFACIPFSGDLRIPDNVKVIRPSTFKMCGFNGILTLPEGLEKIDANAFAKCGFRGELKLPESLKDLSDYAFTENRISSVVFPQKLNTLGQGVFINCKNLKGSIEIPENILRINNLLFAGCSGLSEVVIPKNVISIGGAAFYDCILLNSIVCNSEEPPMAKNLDKDLYVLEQLMWDYGIKFPSYAKSFEGVNKGNLTLTVPEHSLSRYMVADGWREFGRMTECSNFLCRPAAVSALNSSHTENLILNSDGEWEVVKKPEWCKLSKTSGNLKGELTVTISELPKGDGHREGKIVFSLKGTEVTTECKISQYDYMYKEDECVTLQTATKGNGIDIVFVGDGWDAESIANGNYLNLVNEQVEHFFGIEPYATYRNRFNVYACMSMSQETGVNTTSTWCNTRFMTFYAHDCDGNAYLGLDDADGVFDYALSHSPLKSENLDKSLIVLTLNNNEYGSNTIITENGSAISICCSSEDSYPMDTRGIIQHEACGHGFGKLAEERISENRYISIKEQNEIRNAQWRGWYQNISLSGKATDVSWADLILDPRYSDRVDIFEGAYGKTRGVYRAEINTCMNYGIPYFSAAARLDIMRRILQYSGEEFTMEKFYATDSDRWGSTGPSTRADVPDDGRQYINSGLHHPVRKVKSKKY